MLCEFACGKLRHGEAVWSWVKVWISISRLETLPGSASFLLLPGRVSSLLSLAVPEACVGSHGGTALSWCPLAVPTAPALPGTTRYWSLEQWLERSVRLGPEEGCCGTKRPLNAAREAQLSL